MNSSNSKEFTIPLMPKARNRKFDELNTILLWNLLPAYFTWQEFEEITNFKIDRSTSWGYERLSFWIKQNQINRIEQGRYIKKTQGLVSL